MVGRALVARFTHFVRSSAYFVSNVERGGFQVLCDGGKVSH